MNGRVIDDDMLLRELIEYNPERFGQIIRDNSRLLHISHIQIMQIIDAIDLRDINTIKFFLDRTR